MKFRITLCALVALIMTAAAGATGTAPAITVDQITATSATFHVPKCGTYRYRVWQKQTDGTWSPYTQQIVNHPCAPPPPAACADGIDNDSPPDGLIDYPNDPGCSSASDNDETDPVSGGTEPPAIAGQGYHLTFGDEFNTLDRSVWDSFIWYDEAPNPAWPNFQSVHDGELDLVTSKNFFWKTGCATCNYPINTVTTLSSGKKFQYGYFETRMKWTGAKGSWPAFWLYSYQHSIDENQCTTQAGEVDVMEGQGAEPDVFYGTVHSNTNGCNPEDDQNGNNWQPMGENLTTGFHKYAALWTASSVSWYVDDKFVMSAPTYATDNQPMYLLLQMWIGGWHDDPSQTGPDLHTEVDYVHVYQK